MIEAILAVMMLAGASILDLQSRRVANRYWLPFLIAGILLLTSRPLIFPELVWIFIQLLLFYVLWRLGLLFGGADAKALMVFAILYPGVATETSLTPALDTLVNSLLLMMVLPVGYLLVNLVRGRFSRAMCLAVPLPIKAARASFVWPMERVKNGRVKQKFMQSRGENMAQVYQELKQAGITTVWATPKVPFMVPLLLGAVLAWWQGNLLLPILGRALTG